MRWSTGRWSPAIGRMERRGVKVDRAYLAKLSGDFADRDRALEQQVYEAAGGPFTIGIAAAARRCAVRPAGPQGRAQGQERDLFDRRHRARAARGEGVEVARLVLDWRQLTKLKSTYTEALQAQINPETGRVHTSYSLSGAQTGRLSLDRSQSAEHPDPHRDRPQDPRRVRRRAGPCADERRLQPDRAAARGAHGRCAAAEGGVRQQGDDIHNLTAMELFGSVDRENRNKAKTINFAILYGISSWGLAGRLGVSRDEGKAIIDRYFERFPGIRNYIGETLAFAREHGFTTTLFGRKTHFPNIRVVAA